MTDTLKSYIENELVTKLEEFLYIDQTDINDDDGWVAIESFLYEYGFIHHQINSMNDFFIRRIRKIVDQNRIIEINGKKRGNYTIEYGEIKIDDHPKLVEEDKEESDITPMEAIYRKMTYAVGIYCDIEITNPKNITILHPNTCIAKIPVMVRSAHCTLVSKKIVFNDQDLMNNNECPYDKGGYFIIKGVKKVINSQETSCYNKIYTFKNRKTNPKFSVYTEIKSSATEGVHSTKVQVGLLKTKKPVEKERIYVVIPYIPDINAIPMGILFKALGAKDEKDIVRHIDPDLQDKELIEVLIYTLEESRSICTQEEALSFIGSKGKKTYTGRGRRPQKSQKVVGICKQSISYAKNLLNTEFLPHVGLLLGKSNYNSLNVQKRYFLGYMVKKLIYSILGRTEQENRDHIANKRIITPGSLYTSQFHISFRRMCYDIKNSCELALEKNRAINIHSRISPKIITKSFHECLSRGSWGTRNSKRDGVSQNFDIFNYSYYLADLRRLTTYLPKDGGKIIGPRNLDNSHFGVACAADTPEGKKTGLVKALAFSGYITVGCPIDDIYNIIKDYDIYSFDEILVSDHKLIKLCKVLLNYDIIGVTDHPNELANTLKVLRRNGNLSHEVSITYDKTTNEVRIFCDKGRLCRPLLVINNGKLTLKKHHIKKLENGDWRWVDLLDNGLIEFLDKEEEKYSLIIGHPEDFFMLDDTEKYEYTHCELHPSMLYGFSASNIPYPDHNQAPRNTYSAVQGKQSIGIPFTNYQRNFSSKYNVMDYLQRPLKSTKASKLLKFDELPAGQNAIVFVTPFAGWGQEDSLVFNQSSIDRGFMRETHYINYSEEVRKADNQEFCIPDNEFCNFFKGNIEKLGEDGIVEPGTLVEKGDILIGKVIKTFNTRKPFTSISIIYNEELPGVVDAVQMGMTGECATFVTVRIRQQRLPVHADKFCLTDDHDVLTSKGWKQISLVKLTDKIACLSEDGYINYNHPTKIYKFDVDAKLYEVNSPHVSLCVTMGHKMYVKKGKNDEKDLFKLVKVNEIIGEKIKYKKWGKNINAKINFVEKRLIGLTQKDANDTQIRAIQSNSSANINRNKNFNNLFDVDIFSNINDLEPEVDSTLPTTKEEIVRYNGLVHCFEVPNHIFMVRRKGKPVWTGNSSRHGQKGTIGIRIRQEDLPFTSGGMVPDLIINPLALPSRMTIAQLIESMSGKSLVATHPFHRQNAGSLYGGGGAKRQKVDPKICNSDATPFDRHFSINDIARELRKLGFNGWGDEVVYDGMSGRQLKTLIFTGPVYYMRLKHMVTDKIHSRNRGPKQTLTRQPTEGRNLDGGFRTGTMEKDCLSSQGVSAIVQESFMDRSDPFEHWVCNICGLPVAHNNITNEVYCNVCDTHDVSKKKLPYSKKLLQQTLLGMNVAIRDLKDDF